MARHRAEVDRSIGFGLLMAGLFVAAIVTGACNATYTAEDCYTNPDVRGTYC